MENLLRDVNRFRFGPKYSPEDWNETIKQVFRPFLRRTSVIYRHRELFRSELVNMAKILPYPANTQLLKELLRAYRRVLRKQKQEGFALLIRSFEPTGLADERWMGMYMNVSRSPKARSAHDRAFRAFNLVDAVLEGSFKPHVRLLYAMLLLDSGKSVPASLETIDFGNLISQMPRTIPNLDLVLEDLEHEIPFSQWRNIAAHKDFRVVSNRTVAISYGSVKNRKTKRISLASVERVLTWSVLSLGVLRMCNTLIYLEYMNDLHALGLPEHSLRLESQLTRLCHNLGVAGFECVSVNDASKTFTLRVRNHLDRSVRDAIIHGSQVLDQLSVALDFDPTRKSRFRTVAIELLNSKDQPLARASIEIEVALKSTLNQVSTKQFLQAILWNFWVPSESSAL